MAFLQAVIDDSGNEPTQSVFVLAGFVTTAANWITFTQEWFQELNREPHLEYFKFSEAMRLREQFDKGRGWNEGLRDERLRALSSIIKKNVHSRFHVSMLHEHHQRYLRDAVPAAARTLLTDTPFCLLAARSLVAATSATIASGLSGELTFYFDTQPGQDVILNALWPQIARHVSVAPLALPPEYQRPRIASPARFESEKVWLPLQAADLLAGARRTEIMSGQWPEQLTAVREIHDEGFELGEQELERMGREFTAMMDQFSADNPGVPLFHYDAQTAARTRKRAKRGMPPRKPRH